MSEGEVIGGPGILEVSRGSEVVITVTSDVSDEVHVHGYDLFIELAAGVPGEIRFVADVVGVFDVELEASHTLLVELRVR